MRFVAIFMFRPFSSYISYYDSRPPRRSFRDDQSSRFFALRREQREKIASDGVPEVWALSPSRPDLEYVWYWHFIIPDHLTAIIVLVPMMKR